MKRPLFRLFVSYNEDGAPIRRKLAGQAAADGPVWQASMMELDGNRLPPGEGEVAVFPVFMQSGRAASAILPARLNEAYARLGTSPELRMMPVWGASPTLADEAAAAIKPFLHAETAVLIVAHGQKGGEQTEEPQHFARRMAELLSGHAVKLAWFEASPEAAEVLASLPAREVVVLPFLAGKGLHFHHDMPSPELAARYGKQMLLLPPLGDLLA